MKILAKVIDDVSERSLSNPPFKSNKKANYAGHLIFGLLLLLWPLTQVMITDVSKTVGYIDPNIWLLILLSMISFLLIVGLCWFLLQRFWAFLGLPEFGVMVLQFKDLELWKQLGFYFFSFVSLLFAGVMCLMAIC